VCCAFPPLDPLPCVCQVHDSESPDDVAQERIAGRLSSYAGAFNEGLYPYGRLNPTVYAKAAGVHGCVGDVRSSFIRLFGVPFAL
jgi:hypothetical protein